MLFRSDGDDRKARVGTAGADAERVGVILLSTMGEDLFIVGGRSV